MGGRCRDRGFISGIGMTRYADSRIVGENSFEAKPHFGCSISDDYLSGVQRVSNSYSAAVME